MKQIVCNASPLITLANAGLLNALPDQFQRVLCPQAVVDEISAGPAEDVMRSGRSQSFHGLNVCSWTLLFRPLLFDVWVAENQRSLNMPG